MLSRRAVSKVLSVVAVVVLALQAGCITIYHDEDEGRYRECAIRYRPRECRPEPACWHRHPDGWYWY